MPNQPINQGLETHIGFQPSGPNGSEDTDHLVINDPPSHAGQHTSEPLIQFKTAAPTLEGDQGPASPQPQFLTVDDLGLESPMQLIGAQDCDEAQPIPTLITFDLDKKEDSKSSDAFDKPVFS